MKKLLAMTFAMLALSASADVTTNVVTNVLYETHVKWETYQVTNGSYEVYSGDLVTNRVYDTPRWIWKNGGLKLITNYVDSVVAGSVTTTVYGIEFLMRPTYYPVAFTNVFTNIYVNGISQR